jgi:ketosteroid isomerase-like protein
MHMKNKRALLSLSLLAGCLGCGPAPVADTSAQDQAAIRALEDHFVTAFNAKDVNGIMAAYAPGDTLVVFDAVPPRQYNGWAAYKKDWEDTFAAFPGPVEMKTTDLDVEVGGDVAFSHCIQSGTLTGKDGKPFPLTVRVTDGYRKINGQWLITHEHVSVPVDFATMKPDMSSK